jgi:hypothetical protein
MNSIKALTAGIICVIILGLTFQLFFIMADVGYNLLMNHYPAIKAYKQIFYYIIGLPGFFLVMATGGYLTSFYARKNVIIHSTIVGALTCGLALYTSINEDRLTLIGAGFFIVGILFTISGSLYWQKNNAYINQSTGHPEL